MKILVVDDDLSLALTLAGFLTGLGYDVATAGNGREAHAILSQGDCRVVISDWEMPEMDGIELCRRVRARQMGPYIYFILLTSHNSRENLIQGLDSGADDFLSKPFEPEELRVRLRAAERVISLESRDLVIFSLARLAESRDSETGAHLERIREYSRLVTEDLSRFGPYRHEIDENFVQMIYLTSPLHDIGKVGIPDAVLLKPGRLTREEFKIMQQHTEIGARTLEDALQAHPQAEFLRVASDIAWCHHERMDGTGYPRGLSGDDIPLCARIVAVCDVYDALTSKRQYKPAYSHAFAKQEIAGQAGSHFDPAVVQAFLRLEAEFDRIRESVVEPDGASQVDVASRLLAGDVPAASLTPLVS